MEWGVGLFFLCDDVGVGTTSVLLDLGDAVGDLDEISKCALGLKVVVLRIGLETLDVHADSGT